MVFIVAHDEQKAKGATVRVDPTLGLAPGRCSPFPATNWQLIRELRCGIRSIFDASLPSLMNFGIRYNFLFSSSLCVRCRFQTTHTIRALSAGPHLLLLTEMCLFLLSCWENPTKPRLLAQLLRKTSCCAERLGMIDVLPSTE